MKNVGKLEITTPSDKEIMFTRTFDAPRQLVFDAWTKPELLKRWLYGPNGWSLAVCKVDLRVGGHYRYEWKHTNGNEMGMGGVYREVVPPERLVNTQLFDQELDRRRGGGHACTYGKRWQDDVCKYRAVCVTGSTRRRPEHADGRGHGNGLRENG